jgi:transcriptional regulator with XRE-family HTH domain
VTADPWKDQLEALGSFIRAQRQLARLSLRDLADRAHVSNPYLSQIERGLHEPSVKVIKGIADALNVSAETLLAQAGLIDHDSDPDEGSTRATEHAIRADKVLSAQQKDALLAVYRGFVNSSKDSG